MVSVFRVTLSEWGNHAGRAISWNPTNTLVFRPTPQILSCLSCRSNLCPGKEERWASSPGGASYSSVCKATRRHQHGEKRTHWIGVVVVVVIIGLVGKIPTGGKYLPRNNVQIVVGEGGVPALPTRRINLASAFPDTVFFFFLSFSCSFRYRRECLINNSAPHHFTSPTPSPPPPPRPASPTNTLAGAPATRAPPPLPLRLLDPCRPTPPRPPSRPGHLAPARGSNTAGPRPSRCQSGCRRPSRRGTATGRR